MLVLLVLRRYALFVVHHHHENQQQQETSSPRAPEWRLLIADGSDNNSAVSCRYGNTYLAVRWWWSGINSGLQQHGVYILLATILLQPKAFAVEYKYNSCCFQLATPIRR